MHIGCITRHAYPTAQEIRVSKFAATLHNQGNDFFVFCPAHDNQENVDLFEYGTIIRFKKKFNGFFGKILFAPIPINPTWAWWFYKKFRHHNIDIVIVRDLRLALPTFIAARLCGIKAILDLGEHYPGMMEILGKQNFTHYITRHHWLITWLEAISVKLADFVWVVVDENKKRLIKYSSNIEVINNYPLSSNKSENKKNIELRKFSTTGDPITIISLGLIDNIRGLDLAIEAFSIIVQDLENVRMLIYGDGSFKQFLEQRVESLKLKNKVLFQGWISEDKKYDAMNQGDIGLILHKACDLTQHTIPNKLFDYMSVGLPIVATQLRPIISILETEQCGIAVEESPQVVADEIKKLILDFDKRQFFSRNGYNAVSARYSWDTEANKIIFRIKDLTRKRVIKC